MVQFWMPLHSLISLLRTTCGDRHPLGVRLTALELDHLQVDAYHNRHSSTKGLIFVTNRMNHLASLLHGGDASSEDLAGSRVAEAGRAVAKPTENTPHDCSISDEESHALRQEKLDAIKIAIARGEYDSDNILEQAMNRMMEQLGLDEPE